MRRTSFADKHCPIARSLEVVGDWWTLLIVREALFSGTSSFEDFRRRLGIASNILTTRLEHLTSHEILERQVSAEGPPGRGSYRLTEKGRELWPVLASLLHWGNRWTDPGPTATVIHTSCGHHLKATAPSCPACDEALSADQLRVQPLLPRHATPGR